MEVCGKRAWELLEKIGFTRIAGSSQEEQAAEILKRECEGMGVQATIETFPIEWGQVEAAGLSAGGVEYPVTGYQCAASTPEGGLEAPFLYVENATAVNLAKAAGKIVLVNGFVRVPLFRSLMKAGVAGIITMEGELRDKVEETDLSTRKLRRTLRAFGNVPMVHMRVADALKLVRSAPETVKLLLQGATREQLSRNVLATLPGTEFPEEIVTFGAHYDSVDFSKGVYDNGAGSVIIMEMLRYFKENPPKRTVKFLWFGSEEIGLEGSWAFVKAHQSELVNHRLMINVDVGGPVLGVDKIAVTGEESFMNFVDCFAKIKGISAEVRQGIYSSDSIPFADSGVPGINFSRDGAPGAAYIHNRFDTLEFMSAGMLEKTARGVLAVSEAVINSAAFPVERKIPEKIVEEVEKYLYKKELAEAAE